MTIGKKIFWAALSVAVAADLWLVALPIYRYATTVEQVSNPKPFNFEAATHDGMVHVPLSSQRFAIPKKFVGAGSIGTLNNGSVSAIGMSLALPSMEHYEADTCVCGRENELFLDFGVTLTTSMQQQYLLEVEKNFDSTEPTRRVTRREPEADDPDELEIYSTPSFTYLSDKRLKWWPGKDFYILRNGEKILYFARCSRTTPDRPITAAVTFECEAYLDFGNNIRGHYFFARTHIKNWKYIHEHLTGLVHSWMQPPALTAAPR